MKGPGTLQHVAARDIIRPADVEEHQGAGNPEATRHAHYPGKPGTDDS